MTNIKPAKSTKGTRKEPKKLVQSGHPMGWNYSGFFDKVNLAPIDQKVFQCFNVYITQILVKEISTKVVFEEVMVKCCQFAQFLRIERLDEARRVCIQTRR